MASLHLYKMVLLSVRLFFCPSVRSSIRLFFVRTPVCLQLGISPLEDAPCGAIRKQSKISSTISTSPIFPPPPSLSSHSFLSSPTFRASRSASSSSSSCSSSLDLPVFMGIAAFTERVLYGKLPSTTTTTTTTTGRSSSAPVPSISSTYGEGRGGGGGGGGFDSGVGAGGDSGALVEMAAAKASIGGGPTAAIFGDAKDGARLNSKLTSGSIPQPLVKTTNSVVDPNAAAVTTTTLRTLQTFVGKQEDMKEFVECVDFWGIERKLRGIRIKSGIRGIFRQI